MWYQHEKYDRNSCGAYGFSSKGLILNFSNGKWTFKKFFRMAGADKISAAIYTMSKMYYVDIFQLPDK